MATILVVDDDAAIRDLIVRLIGIKGHRPLEAADGAEGLALASSQRPDLVISDILMPTMDGFEFVRRLRADAALAATEVLFYTAHYLERQARNLARACGVTRVLAKPSQPEELLRAIEEALAHTPPAAAKPIEGEFDRDHLRLMTDKLSEKVADLRAANFRLTALNDVNLALASETDPHALLEAVCHNARALLGARHAILCVRDKSNASTPFFAGSGFGPAALAALPHPRIDAGSVGRVLAQCQPLRGASAKGDSSSIGLPEGYPDAQNWLIVPIASLGTTYGWICLLNKLGSEEFDEADERVLASLALQVGRIYENGSLYTSAVRHAEELRESEQRVRQLNTDLEQRVVERTAELVAANKELESFDYSVSHDLRAPLRHIQGFAGMLLSQHGEKLDERGQDCVKRVLAASKRMDQLVTDLLHLSTATQGELQRADIDLSGMAEAVLANLRKTQGERQITCVVQPGLKARADPGLIHAVLDNLIGNAWKFTRRREDARIDFGAACTEGQNVFFVRDNGAGFDMAYADKLFAPLQRLHSQEEFEGTGIGLATVQRIIRRHGGKVWAESSPGEGATFYFTF